MRCMLKATAIGIPTRTQVGVSKPIVYIVLSPIPITVRRACRWKVCIEERTVEPEEIDSGKKSWNLHTSTLLNSLSSFALKSLEVRRRIEGFEEGMFFKASVTDSVKSP